MKESIELVTRFISPIMTAREYINFSKEVLTHLGDFHSLFKSVNSCGASPDAWTEIDKDFKNFERVVFDHIYDGDIKYKNDDRSQGFFLDSISWAGFSNSYSNMKNEQEGKYSVSIGAGDENGIGFININIPSAGGGDLNKIKSIKLLILHILKVVNVYAAYAFTDSLFKRVVDYSEPYDIQVGWINYFSQQEVIKHLPPNIIFEQLTKGAFFWLDNSTEVVSETVISKATEIRNSLGKLGYLD